MRVKVVTKNHYTLLEVDGKKGLTSFLESQYSQRKGMVAGALELLERVANEPLGPRELTTELCHQLDPKNDIWEFIKGRFRILWFEDEGKVILCTHAFMKKSGKVPPAEIEMAVRIKEKYLSSRRDGTLELIDDENEE